MDALLTDLKKLTKGVSIDSRPDARRRHTLKTTLKAVLYFILSFGIVYAISVGLQNLSNPGDSKDVTKKVHVQENDKAPEQSEKTNTQDK